MTASVTHGRALRYAKGSARGLLHHVLGHCLGVEPPFFTSFISTAGEDLIQLAREPIRCEAEIADAITRLLALGYALMDSCDRSLVNQSYIKTNTNRAWDICYPLQDHVRSREVLENDIWLPEMQR